MAHDHGDEDRRPAFVAPIDLFAWLADNGRDLGDAMAAKLARELREWWDEAARRAEKAGE